MFPESRYVRDRRERKPTSDSPTLNEVPRAPQSPAAEQPPAKVNFAPSPPLQQVEKPHPLNLIPMPGGVWRNLDYSGPLTKEEVDQVQRNYPLYKEAEGITGVNWKVIAAVHYRESDLGMNKAAQGNEFQFSGSLKKRATGDLLHDALETGNILQEKALRGGIWPLLPDQSDGEGVRIALFQYNGTGYRKLRTPGAPIYDQSPYVMNQIDDQHRDMKKYRFDHEPIPTGTDKQMGAVPFIREMAKAFFD